MMVSVAVYGMAAEKKFTLVIDAGHGGKDTGAPGKMSVEKNINLKVALAFGKYVERNCPDVKVIYTRTTDVFIPLIERANIANRNKADLFISVHTNALDGGKISRGFETYTLGMHRAADNLNVAKRENSVILIEKNYKQSYAGFDPKSSESYIIFELMQDKNMSNSVEMAKLIQSEVCSNSGRVNKGVHQAGFLVLRETSMLACLIELGFITTPDEEEFLNTDDGQDKMAQGIYKAFVKYKRKYGNAKNGAQNDHQQDNMDAPLIADDGDNEGGNTEYSEQRAVRQNIDAVTAMATPPTTVKPEENQPAGQSTITAQSPPSSSKTTAQTTTNPPADKPAEPTPSTSPPAKPSSQNTAVATTTPETKPAAQPVATPSPAEKPQTQTTATTIPETKPATQPTATASPTPKPEAQTTATSTPETTPADSKTKESTVTPTEQTEEVVPLPEDMNPGGRPIFKVQIAATSQKLPTDSPVFMGVKGVEYYTENNMTKYTVGASTDYEEIRQLRSSLAEKFPQSFIIAFRDGYKMEMWKALKEYKENLKKNK